MFVILRIGGHMKNSEAMKAILLSAISHIVNNSDQFVVQPGKDFTRLRKISLKDLLIMILTMEAGTIRDEIYRFFGRNADAPTNSSFYKQRQKLKVTAFQAILQEFNRKLSKKLYNDKYQLIATDGSSAEIFRNPQDEDTFMPPNGKSRDGFNQIHINANYSILDRRFTDIVIQPARKKNEYSAFCQMVDTAGENGGTPIIYIADMGYASYNNFAHVIQNRQFFLIRCNDRRFESILGHPVGDTLELDQRVERILSRTHSKKKISLSDRYSDYRYICKDVPFDYINEQSTEYTIQLRLIRFELDSGKFENIVTNLPANEFEFRHFKELYRLRWTEENSFRDLKGTLGLTAFHSKKYEYIEQEVWARVILHNFCASIATEVNLPDSQERTHKYQINYSEAFKACREHFRSCGGRTPMVDVESVIVRNILPVRDDRSYERKHRYHSPFSFWYRN